MRWERLPRTKGGGGGGRARRGGTLGPGKRWGHTCNALKQGRALYVFGGYGKENRQTHDVHVFDTTKQTWSKPMVKGTPPTPRDSHTCTTVGSSLFVFGGTDGMSPLQDLYILDTATNTWSKPQVTGDGPPPREGHSAALIDHNLYIFGGCGKTLDGEDDMYFNDLYILDTGSLHWSEAVTKGTLPVPRDSHTCSAWENKLVVLGGEDASDCYLADVQILDTDMMEWRELPTTGQMLTPRAGHATVLVGKHAFIFGGFTDDRKLFDDLHMLNLETGAWIKVITEGVGPSPRFSVAGDCIDARSRGILVFIGGCNENLEPLDDMYYLDTEMQLEKPHDGKPEKYSLRKELKRKRQENQFVLKTPELEKEAPLPPTNIPKSSTALSIEFPTCGSALSAAVGVRSSLYEFKPAEEKIFEAKITDVFHYGYTIESNIDGKLLRGLLFSYKPGFAHAVHSYLTRKKLALDRNADNANEDTRSKLHIACAHSAMDGSWGVPGHGHGGESLVTPSKHPSYFVDPYQHVMKHPQVPSMQPFPHSSSFVYEAQLQQPSSPVPSLQQNPPSLVPRVPMSAPHQEPPSLLPDHQQVSAPMSSPQQAAPPLVANHQQMGVPMPGPQQEHTSLVPNHLKVPTMSASQQEAPSLTHKLRVPVSSSQQDARHFVEPGYGEASLTSIDSVYQAPTQGGPSSEGMLTPSSEAAPQGILPQDGGDFVMHNLISPLQVASVHDGRGQGDVDRLGKSPDDGSGQGTEGFANSLRGAC